MQVPSSTDISKFESGLRAITAIFLRFSNGKVYDLLLQRRNKPINHQHKPKPGLLYEIENRDAVSHWTKQRVSIWSENDIPLTVNRAAYV
jgi:hypothetical protein